MLHESSRALCSHRTQTGGSCASVHRALCPQCPAASVAPSCLALSPVTFDDGHYTVALFLSELCGGLGCGGLRFWFACPIAFLLSYVALYVWYACLATCSLLLYWTMSSWSMCPPCSWRSRLSVSVCFETHDGHVLVSSGSLFTAKELSVENRVVPV